MNPFAWLNPGRWLLLAALIAALLAGVWRLDVARQAIGYNRAKAEYTAAALKAEQAARVKEKVLQSQLQKAQDDAKIRETKLAADASRAHAAADGLRNDLGAIRASLPGLARDAINQYADTASVVFAECVREYSSVAEAADRIDSDRQTLSEAWPK